MEERSRFCASRITAVLTLVPKPRRSGWVMPSRIAEL
jgi:hypothetical protein